MKKLIVPLLAATLMTTSTHVGYAQDIENNTNTENTINTSAENTASKVITVPDVVTDTNVSIGNNQNDNITINAYGSDADKPYPTYRTVNQGDVFFTEGFGRRCTIGFVTDGLAYTAAHCIPHSGAKIYDAYSRLIGVAYRPTEWDTNQEWGRGYNTDSEKHDFAIIQLIDGVQSGENTYSGDTMYTAQVGDTLCTYGARKNFESCGTVYEIKDGIVNAELTLISGDSGGPAWVPNKGFVGYTNAASVLGKEGEDGIYVKNSSILQHRDDLFDVTIPSGSTRFNSLQQNSHKRKTEKTQSYQEQEH